MPWSHGAPHSRRGGGGVLTLGQSSEVTISGGEITVTRSFHTIDTESDAASDDLDTVNGIVAGGIYVFQQVDAARDVTLKHGTGNLRNISNNDTLIGTTEGIVVYFSPDGVYLDMLIAV